MEAHDSAVSAIVTSVNARDCPCPNTTPTAPLSHVLQINTTTKTVLVEPNVPMNRLVQATLKHGLVPPVVMEFPGITVGGGYARMSGESSSFKHGFFNKTVNWVDIVLADGEVVKASPTERWNLFEGAAGAVGTLGIVVLLEVRLIEAKRFVETTHRRVESDVDYVDGLLFKLDLGLVITGKMTDEVTVGVPIRSFSRSGDPWFYMHAKHIALDRYDRGGFWVGDSIFKYFHLPFNRLTRKLLDYYLLTRTLYACLHASGFSNPYVVQDLALPYSTTSEFIEYADKEFGIYPLWLCPLRQDTVQAFYPHNKTLNEDGSLKPMLNIGLWGLGPLNDIAFLKKNRGLEDMLRKLGGMKWLYANTYYTEKAFWEIYDGEWYGKLREKYQATSLPSVWQKVHSDAEKETKAIEASWWLWFLFFWPVGGLHGMHHVWKGKKEEVAKRGLADVVEVRT
ncbi:hypothetical protein BKA61DRAFT_631051 [Leptodontidium sp. MPI-SDFR-AT-0119]|nr:hypothetical protein BKA61DRAFT_631051 [Leptodontidium sp. MPI-SDFR-AT-0119]